MHCVAASLVLPVDARDIFFKMDETDLAKQTFKYTGTIKEYIIYTTSQNFFVLFIFPNCFRRFPCAPLEFMGQKDSHR